MVCHKDLFSHGMATIYVKGNTRDQAEGHSGILEPYYAKIFKIYIYR